MWPAFPWHAWASARRRGASRRCPRRSPAGSSTASPGRERLSNAEIAKGLHISEGTAKAHISRILSKLQCGNRVQAAIIAHDAGVLHGQ
ncbi:response regulator transcription factor [Kutzneria buriramensis]|uniref:response regulator transcription factor n=1 Tax=Kutzneria buriramensis TaxID=1045776 RepID=UPI000E264D6F|nr:LuxR C-terminal-related transcriptional regulator [Kutzneria buriramensis]